MRASSRANLLLILTLLFGVWTAAVHGSEHDATLKHIDDCAVCVFAQGLGSSVTPATTSLVLADAPSFVPVLSPRTAVCAAPRSQIRVRGPPLNPA